MIARVGLEFPSRMRRFPLANLARTFRQSATAMSLVGCVAAQRSPKPPPTFRAEHSNSATSANWARPADIQPVPKSTGEAPQPEAVPSALSVMGFEPAVLRLSTYRRTAPLFVITHGAGGQAEWHCEHYEAILGPSASLLCLAGKRMVARDPTRGYYYPDHVVLSNEIVAARVAIREKHSGALSGDSDVYVGYSQGATMGALAVAGYGAFFTRLLLVEGGFDSWSPALARKYRGSGGQRVLFVCGTEHCHKQAAKAAATLSIAGVEVKVLYAPNAGHRPDGPVALRVREGLPWLLEGDSRYTEVLEHVNHLP